MNIHLKSERDRLFLVLNDNGCNYQYLVDADLTVKFRQFLIEVIETTLNQFLSSCNLDIELD